MGRIKLLQILACATLFSTSLSVNALVNRPGSYEHFKSSSSLKSLRVTSGLHLVKEDGILLGDSGVTRDGVVLGDRSIFCSDVSRVVAVERERGGFLADGVVLGDEFVGQTSSTDIAAKR